MARSADARTGPLVRPQLAALTATTLRTRLAVIVDRAIPCSSLEHFGVATNHQYCALHRSTADCGVCGAKAAECRSCVRCRLDVCAHCLASTVLSQLDEETCRALLRGDSRARSIVDAARPHAGEWPTVDEHGRVFAWFCWTGDNPLPEYLRLCVETFAHRAAAGYCVRLVRPADVDEAIGGRPHPAYEHLSLVHRADYLRCELLHRHGGLYCDVDTICVSDLSHPLSHLLRGGLDEGGCAAIVAEERLLVECGLNAGLFRRGSYLTRCWRRALHARLDARLDALRAFRRDNDDPREDGLQWNEILRDLIVPLVAALRRLWPGLIATSLRARHWFHPEQPQGYDPLSILADDLPPAGAAAEAGDDSHVDVIILNNNQYSGRVKVATRDEFLQGGSALAQMVRAALANGYS